MRRIIIKNIKKISIRNHERKYQKWIHRLSKQSLSSFLKNRAQSFWDEKILQARMYFRSSFLLRQTATHQIETATWIKKSPPRGVPKRLTSAVEHNNFHRKKAINAIKKKGIKTDKEDLRFLYVASCMLELSGEPAGDRKPSSNSLSSPAGNQSSINQFVSVIA